MKPTTSWTMGQATSRNHETTALMTAEIVGQFTDTQSMRPTKAPMMNSATACTMGHATSRNHATTDPMTDEMCEEPGDLVEEWQELRDDRVTEILESVHEALHGRAGRVAECRGGPAELGVELLEDDLLRRHDVARRDKVLDHRLLRIVEL